MTNLGMLDRVVRIVLGLGLIAIVFVGPQTAWGFLGAVPLLTGLAGYCPLYRALGISTNRRPPGSSANAHSRAVT